MKLHHATCFLKFTIIVLCLALPVYVYPQKYALQMALGSHHAIELQLHLDHRILGRQFLHG